MRHDARILQRAQKLAEREAERLAAGERVHAAEVRVRAAGSQVHLDVDVEG
jgi:hypothetical protein